MSFNNHVKRVLTSIFALPLIIIIVYIDKGLPFNLLIMASIFLGMKEFYQIMENGGVHCFKISGILLGIGLAFVFTIKEPGFIFFALTASGIILLLKTLSAPSALSKNTLPSLSCTFLGLFYVPWMLGFLILIRSLKGGEFLIFYLLAIIWVNDILAYYTGSCLGRHLLCPKISPKKTLEGAAGGLLGSMLAALLLGPVWIPEASLFACLMLGLSLGSFGQLGDLSESVLKRWAGVKESGSILPGHGGLLDRIDGLLFCAPVFYYYIVIILCRG